MSRGVYPQELAFLLDNPLRRFILSPRQLADVLPEGVKLGGRIEQITGNIRKAEI